MRSGQPTGEVHLRGKQFIHMPCNNGGYNRPSHFARSSAQTRRLALVKSAKWEETLIRGLFWRMPVHSGIAIRLRSVASCVF